MGFRRIGKSMRDPRSHLLFMLAIIVSAGCSMLLIYLFGGGLLRWLGLV